MIADKIFRLDCGRVEIMFLESRSEKDLGSSAAAVFDSLATRYDSIWTSGSIGRLQRQQVWRETQTLFRSGDRVLEIGCGTGVDAVHLAKAGICVHAIDVSVEMLAIARARIEQEGVKDRISLEHRAIEQLKDFQGSREFDGAFSNFGAFNCVRDLKETALAMAKLVRPGGKLVLCYINRFCLWEIAWYLCHSQPDKAFRRLSAGAGGLEASLHSDSKMRVFYPKAKELISHFQRHFSYTSSCGIGVFIPPSFMEDWVGKRPKFLWSLALLDRTLRYWPILRGVGDHRLLVFARRTDSNSREADGA
jgi:ubiquinone/menaquinone biosynthesis C-methylase UbiE